jgi:hypothetical protein
LSGGECWGVNTGLKRLWGNLVGHWRISIDDPRQKETGPQVGEVKTAKGQETAKRNWMKLKRGSGEEKNFHCQLNPLELATADYQ